jgi:sterol desaturase/sphingolipid hydroxylase (fatty acid hydroxylase superfamily)
MQNIVSNAIKYRKPGRAPKIDITAATVDEKTIRFAIVDYGVGRKNSCNRSSSPSSDSITKPNIQGQVRHPYRSVGAKALKQSHATNTSAFLFNNVIMSILSVSSLLIVAAQYSQYGLLGGVPDGVVKWVLSFVLFDFAVYAWHYAAHHSEFLWRFHKIHHSDKSFHVTTGLRFHVFDQLLEVVVKYICVIVIGVNIPVVIVCEVLRMAFVFFHHSNLSFPGEKWLSYIIITPNLHRAHHSSLREEHDSNYGIVLSVWDLMFDTRKELVPGTWIGDD